MKALPRYRSKLYAEVLAQDLKASAPKDHDAAQEILRDAFILRQSGWGKAVALTQSVGQLLSLASTHSMMATSDAAFAQKDVTQPLLRYVLTGLLAPPVVRAVQSVLTQGWTNGVRERYEQAFVAFHQDRPSLWIMSQGQPNERATRSQLYAAQLRWHADNQVKSRVALQGAALEMLVQGALFGVLLGRTTATGLLISLCLTYGYGKRAFNVVNAHAKANTQAEADHGTHLRRLWDNVVLGNINVQDRFEKRYQQTAHARGAAQKHQAAATAQRDITLMLLALLPVVLGVALSVQQQAQKQGLAAAKNLIVIGPQVLRAAGKSAELSRLYWDGSQKRQAELNRTLAAAYSPPSVDLAQLCTMTAIAVTGPQGQAVLADAWPQLLNTARNHQGGRYTLTGENGAGKSIALLMLKQELGKQGSLMLPADLRDLTFTMGEGSTGERDRMALHDVLGSAVPVLLLDEWDAHLDAANCLAFDRLLDQISRPLNQGGEGRTVIEISHRRTSEH